MERRSRAGQVAFVIVLMAHRDKVQRTSRSDSTHGSARRSVRPGRATTRRGNGLAGRRRRIFG